MGISTTLYTGTLTTWQEDCIYIFTDAYYNPINDQI